MNKEQVRERLAKYLWEVAPYPGINFTPYLGRADKILSILEDAGYRLQWERENEGR